MYMYSELYVITYYTVEYNVLCFLFAGYWLCYINSTINPICYALCNANFRRTYWRILTCRFGKRARRPQPPKPYAYDQNTYTTRS